MTLEIVGTIVKEVSHHDLWTPLRSIELEEKSDGTGFTIRWGPNRLMLFEYLLTNAGFHYADEENLLASSWHETPPNDAIVPVTFFKVKGERRGDTGESPPYALDDEIDICYAALRLRAASPFSLVAANLADPAFAGTHSNLTRWTGEGGQRYHMRFVHLLPPLRAGPFTVSVFNDTGRGGEPTVLVRRSCGEYRTSGTWFAGVPLDWSEE